MNGTTKVHATIEFLKARMAARDAGAPVSYTTDPSWLINEAINRRAGWLESRHTRGTVRPVNGRFPRKAEGDWQRHLYLIAREINTPRRIVRPAALGEHRWLLARIPDRFTV